MYCKHCGRRIANTFLFCNHCGTRTEVAIYTTPPRQNWRKQYGHMPKLGRIAASIAIFYGTFLLYHIVFSSFFPVDDKNVLQAPDWYMYLGFAISAIAVCAYIITKRRKDAKKTQAVQSQIIRLANIKKLAENARRHYSWALESDSVGMFTLWWDEALQELHTLDNYRGTAPSEYFTSLPTYSAMEKEFQWRFRDSIERAKNKAISDIRGEHHNNKNGRFQDIKESVELYSNRMNQETFAYAQSALIDVAKVAQISNFILCKENVNAFQESGENRNAPVQSAIEQIDYMNGIEFENWCAELLIKIGYINVTVTRGSGDQGVDILAKKDDVTYAVQCKCYSKDLGNKPIQEVATGKIIYGCNMGAVMTNRYFTSGAKEAAIATGTLLWDRDWIKQRLPKE